MEVKTCDRVSLMQFRLYEVMVGKAHGKKRRRKNERVRTQELVKTHPKSGKKRETGQKKVNNLRVI